MLKIREKFILWRIQQGKIKAFEEIYNFYAPKIYKFIYFKVSLIEDAEDLTSQTFTKFLKYLTKKKTINNLQALLYNIAKNLIIDFYRQKKQVSLFDDKIKDQLVDEKNLIENLNLTLDLAIDIKNIKKAIEKLDNEDKEIIILRFVNDLSIREISKILGKSQINIRVSLHRALKRLREMIKK
ncbi:sigma-70 family RNA polymerase sigma factor [Candidatus Kuenenbacteria bacterium]|nr:sigma-70 family RNA polymerase sigma factor [Candidatus Kuenenbacteria bacterium]